jgi:beta-glucosidase
VTNSGALAGAEVVQLYIAYPAAAGAPPQQLRAFHKTAVLAPGGQEVVTLAVDTRGLSVFDAVADDWAVVPGSYGIRVGSGSRDIRVNATVVL